MAKYHKKPVVIEAEQYVEYGKFVKGMCNSQSCYLSGNDKPHVHTIHDNQIVNLEIGDYIIPEPDGIHFYPCKPDIFEKTYEEVTEDSFQSFGTNKINVQINEIKRHSDDELARKIAQKIFDDAKRSV